ncbi:MAG: tRNA (adenine(22)-N(1))-methyltransferase [Suilimivivens sp.]
MGRMVELSKRMQAVADMVSEGSRVCDVGCDHGYVSIYLVQSGKSPSVLAMDVNQGPLSRAACHVSRYGVEKYITLRLSDGLTAYRKGEADTLLCAGMGGRLLMDILTKEPEKTADFKELILQPQSEIPLFRNFLREKGYIFLKEDMILEEGKFYPLMKVCLSKSGKQCTEDGLKEKYEMEDLLGPLLLAQKHPVLLLFIKKEILLKQEILDKLEKQEESARNISRKRELQKELTLLRKAESLWNA